MLKPRHAAALLAALLVAVQPCAAADDMRGASPAAGRTAAFAGMNLRLPLGRAGAGAPSARFQIVPMRTAATPGAIGSGIELGLAPGRKPALFIGGQNAAEIERKVSVGGSTTTALVIGGAVLLGVLLLASVASALPKPGPQKGAFD